jgi:V/A-type H+-transporting ATPase subunit K
MATEVFFGQLGLGLTLGLAAIGSAVGIGAAGRAAVGAWAKEAKAGKPLNFSYIILVGMPLSQTIYAFVLMLVGLKAGIVDNPEIVAAHAGTLFGIGLAGGLAELFSAWMQGLIGAAACRAISEGQGKGLAFMIIAMGIVETVGLFGFVFLLLMIPGGG